jgi:cobalamin biosynthesis protein CobT
MHGIEVVPKREVVLAEAGSLSVADRLLLNRDAKKALEAEEMGASRDDEYPLGEEDEEEQEQEPRPRNGQGAMMEIDEQEEEAEVEQEEEQQEADEEQEEEAEEEQEEEEQEEAEEEQEEEEQEEAEEEELTPFEYKGNTFYRDSENKVFMTDEDGDVVQEPIGTWNPERNRIIMNPRD